MTALLALALLAPPSLEALDTARNADEVSGLWSLGAWGAANTVAGVVGHFTSEGEWQAFHQMNGLWGVVNLSIAAPALIVRARRDPVRPDLSRSLRSANGHEKAFLLNLGLDVAYLTAGGWLWERGLREADPRQTGFGWSIMLQGGSLLAYDVVMYVLERGHTEQLYLLVQPLEQGSSVGVGGRF